jgi:ribosomal protein S18 acetylase RimI-like enzyme
MIDLTELVFQRATANDAAALLDLEQRVAVARIYEARTRLDDVVREIEGNALFLITYRRAVIGSASFRVESDGRVYVGNVAVDPAYRRQGVSRAAMTFVAEQNPQAARFELVTHPDNDPALRLYASLGFRAEARHENYFGDGEPRLRLVRNVRPARS